MEVFNLKVRECSDLESTLLFPFKHKKFKVLELLDLENYADAIIALNKGTEIVLDGIDPSKLKDINTIYFYNNYSINNTYLDLTTISNNSGNSLLKEKKESIFPKEYYNYVNSLIIVNLLDKAVKSVQEVYNVQSYKKAINIANPYELMLHTLGHVIDGKLYSISSIYSYNTDISSYEDLNSISFEDEKKKAISYILTNTPKYDVSNGITDQLISEVNIKLVIINNLIQIYRKFYNDKTFNQLMLSCANNYINYNGLVIDDESIEFLITNKPVNIDTGSSHFYGPYLFSDTKGNTPVYSLSAAFTKEMSTRSSASWAREDNLYNFFSGMNFGVPYSGYYNQPKTDNFFYINNETTSSKTYLEKNFPENFKLDISFFQTLYQEVANSVDYDISTHTIKAGSGTSRLPIQTIISKVKKTLAIKPVSIVSIDEVFNNRYMKILSRDKKFFYLQKTSKTKLAQKQAAITRSITTLMQPLASFLLKMGIITDLTLPKSRDSYLNYAVSAEYCAHTCSDGSENPYKKHIMSMLYSWNGVTTNKKSLLDENITSLYNDVSFNTAEIKDSMFNALYPCKEIYSLRYCSPTDLTSSCLGEFVKIFKSDIENGGVFLRQLSGDINLYKIVNSLGIYTAKELVDLYKDNFLQIDVNLTNKILKSPDRVSTYDFHAVEPQFSTGFTFSDTSVSMLKEVKKCKTLNDYFIWYKKYYKHYQLEIDKIIKGSNWSDDSKLVNRLLYDRIFTNILHVLDELQLAEAPFIKEEDNGNSTSITATNTGDSSTDSTVTADPANKTTT